MNAAAPPVFRPEEFPEVEPRLLELLSDGFRAQYHALQSISEHAVHSGSFLSAASGVSSVSVKNPLPQKPRHVTVSLRRDDLADFSAAWSWWFVMSGDTVVLKFVGLPASTKHVFSVGLS